MKNVRGCVSVLRMFQKRKKFAVEQTPQSRLSDRWEQQVFFILRKYPNAKPKITAIMKSCTTKKQPDFVANEAALDKLTNLYAEMQDISQ